MEQKSFSSVEDEMLYYKELAQRYRQEKLDCQKEFEDFTDESRQLEQELEATLVQNDKQIRDLSISISSLRDENESLRHKVNSYERESQTYETKLNQILVERENLKSYIRELEQKNDDLERTNRVVSESVTGFEAMLNQAYEKNAMLEMEIDEKEQLQINLQRLMDEARDLKQELKIRNIAIPQKQQNRIINDSMSPIKNSSIASNDSLETTINVGKINDINDSKNNNNTTGLAGIFQNISGSVTTPAGIPAPSDRTPTTAVLKYDCNMTGGKSIAASTRISALNIVADLLKKLDNLETKLKSWKTQPSHYKKPTVGTSTPNASLNALNNCTVDNLENININ